MGVILDAHILNDHIRSAENKVAKNIDFINRVNEFLDEDYPKPAFIVIINIFQNFHKTLVILKSTIFNPVYCVKTKLEFQSGP